MSTRNSNSKSNSSKPTTRQTQAQPTTSVSSSTRNQPATQVTTSTTTTSTTRRARKPMTIRVRVTGEEIRRVPVERSGYRVVRYEGRYHTVRGGGRTAPYIVGAEDGEDSLGRA